MEIYIVKQGDTLYSISQRYNLPINELVQLNGLESLNLAVGQAIVIPNGDVINYELAANGYAYPSITEDLISPLLTYISVFTYGFTPSGGLIVPENTDSLLEKLPNDNIQPLMAFSTLTEEGIFSNYLAEVLLNDEALRETLIENIVNEIEDKNYYGIDIDFEFIPPESKDAFVSFIRQVKAALPDRLVCVALAPKTSADQKGLLYESHDYGAIAEAADKVLLMTYEWGYTYGPPLPVAPIDKVEEVVDYALTEMPPHKIFMGIPNYAYDWKLPFVRGESRARSLSNPEAAGIAANVNAVIEYDETAQTPYFYYTSQGVRHIVYFEDARSITAKLNLVSSKSLYGISIWNLMRPFPQMWAILSQYSITKG